MTVDLFVDFLPLLNENHGQGTFNSHKLLWTLKNVGQSLYRNAIRMVQLFTRLYLDPLVFFGCLVRMTAMMLALL